METVEFDPKKESAELINRLEVGVHDVELCVSLDSAVKFNEEQYAKIQELAERVFKVTPRPKLDRDVIESIVLPIVWGGTKEEFKEKSKTRKKELVRARAFIFIFLRLMTSLSLSDVGDPYGKDHATVLTAINTLLSQLYLPQNKHFFTSIVNELLQRGYPVSSNIKGLVVNS